MVWARWIQGLIITLMNFFANPKMLKKRRNTRLEKYYGHVNIATAIAQTCRNSASLLFFVLFLLAL